jgi:ketosteroid isomerase-like protein
MSRFGGIQVAKKVEDYITIACRRQLWGSMRDVKFTFLQRFATVDRVVDDSLVTFEVIRDGYWHFPVGSKVEMRLVHIFEMRDGKISREQVFDMGRLRR